MIRDRRGTSLLEVMVVTSLLAVLLTSLATVLLSARTTTRAGEAMSANTENAQRLADLLRADLEETGIEVVDTSAHLHDAFDGVDIQVNHYFDPADGLRQCSSPVCAWHTTIEGAANPIEKEHLAVVSRRYRRQGGQQSIDASGRVWLRPATDLCPLDGSYATAGAELDLLMLLSPRDESSRFVTDEASALEVSRGLERAPDWQAIVFYFPWFDERTDRLELRRTFVTRADLTGGDGQQSADWDVWQANRPSGQPTLVDLLDFGIDGTLDGQPDGSIPLRPEDSDAQWDWFGISGRSVYREKYLSTDEWIKYFYLSVDRQTGDVAWYVYFSRDPEGDGDFVDAPYWWRWSTVNRAPIVLTRHLVDLDVSTAVSNPRSTNNPWGVANLDTVRATIVFDRPIAVGGRTRHIEHALALEVLPRNSLPPLHDQ